MKETERAKYQCIYCDPPWTFSSRQYQDSGRDFKNLREYYPVLSKKELESLPIQNITAENAFIFMWTTDAHLHEAIHLIETWGFRYVTIAFIWIKTYHTGSFCYNFSPNTLKSCEICLLGKKGSPQRADKTIRQLVIAERKKHSQKPLEIR